MTPHERALEAAARAMIEATSGPFEMLDETGKEAARFEARAAVTAYLAEAGDGWRDIETAPKDGTLCLFFAPGRSKAKYIERAKRQMIVVDAFSDNWRTGKYQLPENPYTHWRPLPAPPAAQEKK
jgi:hypothetical protein